MGDDVEDLYKYENELYERGVRYIGGVDEVGRGPLIGPVVASCVVLPRDFKLDGLTDSKKLSEKKRNLFYDYIVEHAIAYGIGVIGPDVIDEVNIYEATKLAMKEAIRQVQGCVPVEHVLIDAMPLDIDVDTTSIIKGDALSISIAASSVIAKVTRDRMMYELDNMYPQYGFGSHKGYPTKKHIEAINKYGLIDGYRKSYGPVKEVLNNEFVSKKSV
ncbi:MAG: ribonuclease HII [Bacilli bacterium]|nr:ribonuclease HII [Bacilli bacterium]